MNFAIFGVNFVNKGAELMLYTIIQQLKQWDDRNIAACHLLIGSYSQRKSAGTHHLAWRTFRRIPFATNFVSPVASLVPRTIRQKQSIILDSEVDVIFDASGFAYSDQWGYPASERMAKFSTRWKNEGKKFILLPQAFGPFHNKRVKEGFTTILKNSDLVFARDETSYKHIIDLPVSTTNIDVGPDFTNLLKPINPLYLNIFAGRPCIVPNSRMLDKTCSKTSQKYISFLTSSISYLESKSLKPFILVHEENDIKIAQELNTILDSPIPILQESNPLMLKAILGQSYLVIGSRYHALISALSQNVPCLGAGWSHKYQALFSDYGCQDLILNIENYQEDNIEILDSLIDFSSRERLLKVLSVKSLFQKDLASRTWQKIYKKIYNHP